MVDAAEALGDLADRGLGRVRVGQIDLDAETHPGPVDQLLLDRRRGELLGVGCGRVEIEVEHCDRGAPLREPQGGRPADAAGSSGVEQASSRMAMLTSDGGSKIELQECRTPRVQATSRDQLGYGFAGITEVAFTVEDIDAWFERVRTAGYETQTDHVWSVGGGRLRSFLFHDDDGSLIQLVEEPGAV